MRRNIIVLLTMVITGCATTPMPACDYKVAGKCKTNSASDISGATTLGHSNNEDNAPKAAAIPKP